MNALGGKKVLTDQDSVEKRKVQNDAQAVDLCCWDARKKRVAKPHIKRGKQEVAKEEMISYFLTRG